MTPAVGTSGILLRFLTALVLVMASYNPSGYSYFHWLRANLAAWTSGAERPEGLALIFFIGVILLAGWTVFVRATLASLGAFGLLLTFAFFGGIFWLIVDFGLIAPGNRTTVQYVTLVLLSGVLAIGVSWSHLRRRISGQLDVNEIEVD